MKDEKISKTLSFILRHDAQKRNMKISSDGFVSLDELLEQKEFLGITANDIQRVVFENDKQRYTIKEINKNLFVRANQGHSMDLQVEMDRIFTPITAIHGTKLSSWKHIQKTGLCRMTRKHIHFASGLNAMSGFRKNSECLIYLDMHKALQDGIEFYKSSNGVILSEGVNGKLDPKYFLRVEFKDSSKSFKLP